MAEERGTVRVKRGLAEMLKGGVIMDVTTAEQAVIAGRDDFICGPAAAAPLADGIPKAELFLLDDAGHFMFLERPDAFRDAVEAFLSR